MYKRQVDRAYDRGMKIALNPSPITEQLKNIDLNKINLLLVNEIEAKTLANVDKEEDVIKFFRENYPDLKIVMTLGAKGSVYIDREKIIRQDSYKVKAIDSTGAGDTFTGYFLGYFYKGHSLEESLEIASKAAALSVGKKGASISIPSHKEVLSFKG